MKICRIALKNTYNLEVECILDVQLRKLKCHNNLFNITENISNTLLCTANVIFYS